MPATCRSTGASSCAGSRSPFATSTGAPRPRRCARARSRRTWDGFTVDLSVECVDDQRGIDFEWRGTLRGTADGVIEFTFDGAARRAFSYSRIGLCVLHPPDFAGARYRARTAEGWLEGVLTNDISPQLPGEHGLGEPLFPAFSELELQRPDGSGVALELAGDVFELEDQRNWTDASFKTYSTPLSLGGRHEASPGMRISQRVRIAPLAASVPSAARRRPHVPVPTIEVGQATPHRVPPIGLGVASHGRPLTPREVSLLGELGVAHLRVDLGLADEHFEGGLEQALAQADALGAGLELALTRTGQVGEIERLVQALGTAGPALERVLVFDSRSVVTPASEVRSVREALHGAGLPVRCFGGTNALFADLNARRTELAGLDGLAYPLAPTVHADDDLSLVETMRMHGETVRTARAFAGSLPIAVTPITLRERSTPQIDVRQPSLLGAIWTLGTAASLAGAGAASLTYYETTGRRGVIDGDPASPAAPVFPLYHVLADLCEWRGARLQAAESSAPLAVEALAVRDPLGATRALIANVTPESTRVSVRGLPPGRVGGAQALRGDLYRRVLRPGHVPSRVRRGRGSERAGARTVRARAAGRARMSAGRVPERVSSAEPVLLRRLDHVAIAVLDTSVALEHFSGRLGLQVVHVDELETPPVTLTYLDAGNIYIQLLSPRADCELSRWLAEHGEGLHHLCFAVDDVPGAIDALSDDGAGRAELGSGRGRVAGFVSDGSPHGVLIECTAFDPADGPARGQ